MSARRALPGWLAAWAAMAAAPPCVLAQASTIAIIRPGPGETIHDNAGAPAGSRVRALVDGKPHGAEQPSPAFRLTGIDRGEHAIRVQVVDSAGNVIASSEPVTFYLWQASALFPSRRN